MQSLFYPRLEMQSYLKLKNMTPEDARLMFAYRVRMADYSENFHGGAGSKLCPLSDTHLDKQKLAFTYPELVQKLNTLGKYENVFKSDISKETLLNIKIITNNRKKNN